MTNNKKILTNNYKKILKIFFISLLVSLFLELYIILLENPIIHDLNEYYTIINTFILYFSLNRFFILLFIFIILITILSNPNLKNKITYILYKYRFLIGALLLIILCIFEIHGSSISCFKLINPNHKPLLGIPRLTRSDEFNVFTPFAFSQYPNNFQYFSSIIRGIPTDMVLIYGQPVWDIVMLFRPFQIGYLFLSPAKGLSFYWNCRLIVLFLVSFEMGMLFTKKNKILSLSYAIVLTFSPWVQWWFSINALVEMLIFGQLIPILLNYYLNRKSFIKKLLITIFLSLCIGGFLIALYPAWEIPLAYIFIFLIIWVLYNNNYKFSKNDIIFIIITLSILTIVFTHIFTKSFNTLHILTNTVYPSSRIYNGGISKLKYIFLYPQTLCFPIFKNPLPPIGWVFCISFFPLNLILISIVLFKQKQKDIFLYGLLIIYIIFYIYLLIPCPSIIGKITFLNKTIDQRLLSVISFIDILILFRSITLIKKPKNLKINNNKILFVICFIASIIIVLIRPYDTKLIFFISILIAFGFYYIIKSCLNKNEQKKLLIVIMIISFFAGGLVNPIESGTDFYFNSEPINNVEKIVQNDPNGLWLVVGDIYIDEIVGVGAHTFNSVHTYPDLESYSKLDPHNNYLNIYNRYAHIEIDLNTNANTTFEYNDLAIFNLHLNINDLEKINISYILTTSDLEPLSNENVTFIKIYDDNNNHKIYSVKYHSKYK